MLSPKPSGVPHTLRTSPSRIDPVSGPGQCIFRVLRRSAFESDSGSALSDQVASSRRVALHARGPATSPTRRPPTSKAGIARLSSRPHSVRWPICAHGRIRCGGSPLASKWPLGPFVALVVVVLTCSPVEAVCRSRQVVKYGEELIEPGKKSPGYLIDSREPSSQSGRRRLGKGGDKNRWSG